jgi:formate dehydrogenase subunit delta
MNIDLLIKMTNEISAFFAAEDDQDQAARDVANHLRRFWDPRMRKQIIAYCEERKGAGLVDLARKGVEVLAEQSRPPPPPPATAGT